MVPVALGRASVLYTFYPPLIGNAFYYIGVVLVVVGSWIWVALMSINLSVWKRAHPGDPVPLAMFANVAGAYLWAWTAVGAALELVLQIIPVALGLKTTIDAGLARVLFSWTLHAIVYFWLIPAYIAFYVIVPRAIGGRLYSDTMVRFPSSCSWWWRCRSACTICLPTRRSAPASNSCIRCSPASSRCRLC